MAKRAVLVAKSIFDVGDDHAVTLFLWLIAHANRSKKGYTIKVDGHKIELGQNQAFLNMAAYARARGVSRKVVLTRVRQLERRDSVGTEKVLNLGLRVTVRNLDFWQDFTNYHGPRDSARDGTGQQAGQPNHLDNHLDKSHTTARAPKSSLPKEHNGAPEPVVAEKDYRASFDKFWEIFPRKSSKGRAWQYWDRMTAAEREKALKYAEAYAEVFKAATDDRRPFFKSAPSWLEGRCWEDDPHEWCLQANVDPRTL